VDRALTVGFCGAPDKIAVSRVALHEWEEPCISGSRGSGTIFFAGCNLRCVFCQNKTISASKTAFSGAKEMTPVELSEAMLALESAGAHNINLVTPTHFAPLIREALLIAKPRLNIPVVYNCSGYESVETIRSLSGLVDIYLPDLKYFSSELSAKYSAAPDYFEVAKKALAAMFSEVGEAEFSPDGMMKKGMIVRHLILPSCRKDSIALISELASLLPVDKIKLSLMRQFTPDFVDGKKYPELCRRLTSFEYDSVVKHASSLGFDGYVQSAESASSSYTPDFNTPEAFLN
jgi:putative pyruvate formate lyase activating enzyme